MSVPKYEPTPLEERLDRIVKDRNDAEMARVFGHVQTAYPHLKDVYKSLATRPTDNSEPSRFVSIMRTLRLQLAGRENFFNKRTNAGQVRDHLAEIFSCPYEFDRKCFKVRCPIQPSAMFSDEINIITENSRQKVVGERELLDVREVIDDVLEMIGQLARRIGSCEMQRTLRTIVAAKGKPWYGNSISQEAASNLADEIVYCYEAVRCEVRLLTPSERAALVYPKKPRRRPDLTIDANPPPNLSVEEKTEFCRAAACERFKRENFHILPGIDFFGEAFDSVKKTEESTAALAKSYQDKKPTLDKGEDVFDYTTLGEVLSADLWLYYDRYFIADEFYEHTQQEVQVERCEDSYGPTPQQKSKERIIELLRGILEDGIKLSSECGSKASEDWTAAQLAFEKRSGDFHSYSAGDDDAAESDLESFLSAFRRGRQRLWADWIRHCRKDVKEKPLPTEPQGTAITNIQKSLRSIGANAAQTALNTTPPASPRDEIIALVRLVNTKFFGGASIPKAINYIRTSDSIDEKLKVAIAKARQFAASFVKSPSSKSKNEDGFWNGIAKDAQESAAKNAAERKLEKNKEHSAPGPFEIPDKSWATKGGD